jgi:hypothetical protein
MHAVLYQRTNAAINMATFLGVFVDCCLFACCSGMSLAESVARTEKLRVVLPL